MKPDIAKKALDSVRGYKIIMSASGKLMNQKIVDELSQKTEITILCPRYEGFDERIINFVDLELSIGNFVLSGGEVPALALIDALARLQSGFMHTNESIKDESFHIQKNGKFLVEYPQYTKPDIFENIKVPDVLKQGNHQKIKSFKDEEALKKTKKNRPDLLL